jgi:hypothetical protein
MMPLYSDPAYVYNAALVYCIMFSASGFAFVLGRMEDADPYVRMICVRSYIIEIHTCRSFDVCNTMRMSHVRNSNMRNNAC